MQSMATSRRALIGGMAGLATFGARGARAAALPAKPAAPVALNVIDVGGQLQLTQRAMEAYAKANPALVSHIAFSQAPAPELPGKLKAQQDAGRVDIDLVLTGTDGLSAGIDQKLWVPVVTDYAAALPGLQEIYLPGAWKMQGLAEGQAVCVVFCPAGPILEYMPDAVKQPPKTAQELLDWTRAHPKRFLYARPANSGPGRTFLQGLPYLLGDKDPKDPDKGWDKTWSFLVELGRNIEYYPTGTTATMKELAEGSRDMIASHLGWDLNPRILGVVPKEAEMAVLQGFHWVTDAQYLGDPQGRFQRQAGGAARHDRLYAEPAGAGHDLRQGVLLSGAGGEGGDAGDGAAGKPDRDPRIHPAVLRKTDRRGAVGDAAARGQARLCLPALGSAGRRAGRQVAGPWRFPRAISARCGWSGCAAISAICRRCTR